MSDGFIMGFPVEAVVAAGVIWDRLMEATSEDEAIEVVRGCGMTVFQFLDEKPGYFGRYTGTDTLTGWQYLRRARNNRGAELIDAVREGAS